MSQLRRSANEVREAGAAKRGRWNPEADSPAYLRYAWWVEQTGAEIEQENFCHYWRVALIWAPLRKLTDKLAFLVKPLIHLGIVLAVLLVGCGVWELSQSIDSFWLKVGVGALVIVGLVWLAAGVVVALRVLVPFIPDDSAQPLGPLTRYDKMLCSVVGVLTFPVFVAVAVLVALIVGLGWLYTERVVPRAFEWLYESHFTGSKWFGWFRPGYALLAALVGLSFEYSWALHMVQGMIGLTLIMGAIVALSYSSSEYTERQASIREACDETEMDDITSEPVAPKRGRLDNALNVAVDFLTLVWWAIVAKKWRICPLVVLPTQPTQLEEELRDSGVQEA
jgi:type IV secretory pathway VirB2 component (pilin)